MFSSTSPHDHIYRLPPPIGSHRLWRFRMLRATACFVLIAGVGLSLETQHVAASLGHARVLGAPFGQALQTSLHVRVSALDGWYAPPEGIRWMLQLDRPAYGPAVHAVFQRERTALWVIGALAAVGAMSFFLSITWRGRPRGVGRRPDESHGSAHFADANEVRAAGVVDQERGIYLARTKLAPRGDSLLLRDASDRCVLACGPQSTGKTVGPAICTLLSDPHASTVTLDIKGDLDDLCSGWAKRVGKYVLRWNPFDDTGRCARYNFLSFARVGTAHDVDDVRMLGHHLCDPIGVVYKDNSPSNMAFWTLNAQNMFTALALHVLYEPTLERKDMKTLADMFGDPAYADYTAIFADIAEAEHDPQLLYGWLDARGKPTKTHPEVARLAREMMRKDPRELSGVVGSLTSRLGNFRSASVVANTCESDFVMEDLFNADRPVALFITPSPGRLADARPLLQLFFAQLTMALVDEHLVRVDDRPISPHKWELQFILDEAHQAGHIALYDVLAYMRTWKARALLLFQDLRQVYETLGSNEMITTACRSKVFFTPSNLQTKKEISEHLGTQTITWEERVVSRGRVEYSPHRAGQPLLSPDQAGMLSDDDALVLIDGHAAIFAQKLRFVDVPTFAERAKLPAPQSSDAIRGPRRAASPMPATRMMPAAPVFRSAVPTNAATRRVAPPVTTK